MGFEKGKEPLFLVVDRCVAGVLTGPLPRKETISDVVHPEICTVRGMPADRKLEHLGNVRMFSALSKKELNMVAKAADVVSIKAGADIVTEGTTGHEFFLILAGQAAVRRGGRKVA